jgi:hypothetical protein
MEEVFKSSETDIILGMPSGTALMYFVGATAMRHTGVFQFP